MELPELSKFSLVRVDNCSDGSGFVKLMMLVTWRISGKSGWYFHIMDRDSNTVPYHQSHISFCQRPCAPRYSVVSFSTVVHSNEFLQSRQLHCIQLGIFIERFYFVIMIHRCEQNLRKITVVYLLPISKTMLLPIRGELRTTNKRMMNINLSVSLHVYHFLIN